MSAYIIFSLQASFCQACTANLHQQYICLSGSLLRLLVVIEQLSDLHISSGSWLHLMRLLWVPSSPPGGGFTCWGYIFFAIVLELGGRVCLPPYAPSCLWRFSPIWRSCFSDVGSVVESVNRNRIPPWKRLCWCMESIFCWSVARWSLADLSQVTFREAHMSKGPMCLSWCSLPCLQNHWIGLYRRL